MIRPMLCAKETLTPDTLHLLPLPAWASPKIDGIRCLTLGGGHQTRSGKQVPNRRLAEALNALPRGLDGELVCGDPTSSTCYNTTMSAVMSHHSDAPIHYYIFDRWDTKAAVTYRLGYIFENLSSFCKLVPQSLLTSPEEILSYYEACLVQGYEGACFRPANSLYKHGRSTPSSPSLLRMKPHTTSEARILEVHPLLHNANAAELSPLGYTERSTHNHNLIPQPFVGSFAVEDIHTKQLFSVGIFHNITLDQRQAWWTRRQTLLGQVFTYRAFPPVKPDGDPRVPVFLHWRPEFDRPGS